MTTKWKYVEILDIKMLVKIETHFNVKLPKDYIDELNKCNRGKPVNYRFDLSSRKECVLDYMINLGDCIDQSKSIKNFSLIPIAMDPFGNYIAYQIENSKKIGNIVFWDHETKSITFIAESFKMFLEMLY